MPSRYTARPLAWVALVVALATGAVLAPRDPPGTLSGSEHTVRVHGVEVTLPLGPEGRGKVRHEPTWTLLADTASGVIVEVRRHEVDGPWLHARPGVHHGTLRVSEITRPLAGQDVRGMRADSGGRYAIGDLTLDVVPMRTESYLLDLVGGTTELQVSVLLGDDGRPNARARAVLGRVFHSLSFDDATAG